MDIWVKTPCGEMFNCSNIISIGNYYVDDYPSKTQHFVFINTSKQWQSKIYYADNERCKEVVNEIQNHIDKIGEKNFNSHEMVYVMPIE